MAGLAELEGEVNYDEGLCYCFDASCNSRRGFYHRDSAWSAPGLSWVAQSGGHYYPNYLVYWIYPPTEEELWARGLDNVLRRRFWRVRFGYCDMVLRQYYDEELTAEAEYQAVLWRDILN